MASSNVTADVLVHLARVRNRMHLTRLTVPGLRRSEHIYSDTSLLVYSIATANLDQLQETDPYGRIAAIDDAAMVCVRKAKVI